MNNEVDANAVIEELLKINRQTTMDLAVTRAHAAKLQEFVDQVTAERNAQAEPKGK